AFDARLGAPLPLDLSTAGAGPGCVLSTSLEGLVPVVTSPAGGAVTPIGVPDLPVLIGGTVLHSWLVSDAAAPWNPAGVVVTSGLAVTIGA
ncbi:MAG: hypothetical protein ACF8XB_19030, partial [Planctomycetota bacterium JB042]